VTITLSRTAGTASSVVSKPLAALPTGLDMSDVFAVIIQASDPAVTVAIAVSDRPSRLLVSDLGWSREQAAAIRAQLAPFEEGWDSPEMDAYDAL